MRPALSVLQLDTRFPRVPGDVASPETYRRDIEILRIPGASVAGIVRDDPDAIDIGPFETALAQAQGDIITTSCGFLSFWQDHLQSLTDRPVVTSALLALPRLRRNTPAERIAVLTFDAARLGPAHGVADVPVLGLRPHGHLREAIARNGPLDTALAAAEVVALAQDAKTAEHFLLECTNLPPYVAALRRATGAGVTSILTELEAISPGLVEPSFL